MPEVSLRNKVSAGVAAYGREQIPRQRMDLRLLSVDAARAEDRLEAEFRVKILQSFERVIESFTPLFAQAEWFEVWYHECTNLERKPCGPWRLVREVRR